VSLSGSVVGIVLNNKNMSIINFIEIYNVFENKTSGPVSLNVIKQLQQWNLIAPDNQLTCDRGHNLKLCEDVRCIDGFTWRCRITSIHKKQKKKCDFTRSIRKDTFFNKSHLSLYQIVSFSYLWLENVSLSFIKKQIKIAQQSAVDWSSFHREITYDAMIN